MSVQPYTFKRQMRRVMAIKDKLPPRIPLPVRVKGGEADWIASPDAGGCCAQWLVQSSPGFRGNIV